MKKRFLLLSVLALLFVGLINVSAQTRITFKRGAKQAVATGNLYSYKSKKVFVIRVRRGQTLSTGQIKSDASARYISVSITDPKGNDVTDSDASCNNRKEVSPTVAGDYRIVVYECMKADAWRGKFRLKVRVE